MHKLKVVSGQLQLRISLCDESCSDRTHNFIAENQTNVRGLVAANQHVRIS